MGNTLVMLTVPDEMFGFGSTGNGPKRISIEISPGTVWAMPEEPWRKLGTDWHHDDAVLDKHRERARRSLEKFLNDNLTKLDNMARSGWFIVEQARCEVMLRERSHETAEKRMNDLLSHVGTTKAHRARKRKPLKKRGSTSLAKFHEHFFSPRAPKDERDGRFDAVVREDGSCWIYHLGEDRFEPMANRAAALRTARKLAAAWVPRKRRT
jgi:hypothetical protein